MTGLALASFLALAQAARADAPARPPITLEVDATDVRRGIVHAHLLIPAALLTVTTALSYAVLARRDLHHLFRLGQQLCVLVAISIAASAYWASPRCSSSRSAGRHT